MSRMIFIYQNPDDPLDWSAEPVPGWTAVEFDPNRALELELRAKARSESAAKRGRLGGIARARSMSSTARSMSARTAARSRWLDGGSMDDGSTQASNQASTDGDATEN